MNEIQIDVVEFQILERGLETFSGFSFGMERGPTFGGDEDFFAFDDALRDFGSDRSAHFVFVLTRRGRSKAELLHLRV